MTIPIKIIDIPIATFLPFFILMKFKKDFVIIPMPKEINPRIVIEFKIGMLIEKYFIDSPIMHIITPT